MATQPGRVSGEFVRHRKRYSGLSQIRIASVSGAVCNGTRPWSRSAWAIQDYARAAVPSIAMLRHRRSDQRHIAPHLQSRRAAHVPRRRCSTTSGRSGF